jgi:hypothetical protein
MANWLTARGPRAPHATFPCTSCEIEALAMLPEIASPGEPVPMPRLDWVTRTIRPAQPGGGTLGKPSPLATSRSWLPGLVRGALIYTFHFFRSLAQLYQLSKPKLRRVRRVPSPQTRSSPSACLTHSQGKAAGWQGLGCGVGWGVGLVWVEEEARTSVACGCLITVSFATAHPLPPPTHSPVHSQRAGGGQEAAGQAAEGAARGRGGGGRGARQGGRGARGRQAGRGAGAPGGGVIGIEGREGINRGCMNAPRNAPWTGRWQGGRWRTRWG